MTHKKHVTTGGLMNHNESIGILEARYGRPAMLTMDQVAEVMGIKKNSLLNLIAADKCPIKVVGTRKIRRANIIDVAKWMDGE